MKFRKVGEERVSIFRNDDILVVDASVDDVEGVQIAQSCDDTSGHESNITLQIGPEVVEVLELVVAVGVDVEVVVVGEIEVQVEERWVFVEGEVADDEIRVVQTCHQILDHEAALLLKGDYGGFVDLFDHARGEISIDCVQSCVEILRGIVGGNGVVSEHPLVSLLGQILRVLLELMNRIGKVC